MNGVDAVGILHIDYVLKENLKEFGWSIEPPASRKKRKRDFFETVGA